MKDGMLEFSDWPMFDLLMTDKELCREVIEIILDESIADIEYIVTEDDVRPTLTNHGVRLDAFVKTKNEIYDIEMQPTKREDLGRRMRYYQGALDTLTLRKGEGYEELPPCIIIFICMHDPFDEGLPVYTLDVNCLEKPSARIGHGFLWKALSAPAWDKLPEGRLQNLLHYVWTGEAGEDPLMGQLAVAVKKANKNENWRKEKMALLTFEEDMEIQRRIAEKKGQERGQIIGLQMGLEQGLAEGLEQGLAEGREQGLAEGREQLDRIIRFLLDCGIADGSLSPHNHFSYVRQAFFSAASGAVWGGCPECALSAEEADRNALDILTKSLR